MEKESLRLQKTVSCSCGKSYALELATEMGLNALRLEVECPGCSARYSVDLDNLVRNKPLAKSDGSYSSGGAGLGENPLSFMEAPQESSQAPAEQPVSSYSSEEDISDTSPLLELFEDEV